MGLMSIIKGEETTLGTCVLCGKKIVQTRIDIGGYVLSDGTAICLNCVTKKNISLKKTNSKDELFAYLKSKGYTTPNEFFPTQSVLSLIVIGSNTSSDGTENILEVDEKRRLLKFIYCKTHIFSSNERSEHIRSFDDLVDFELLNDGSKIGDGNSFLGTAIGGLTFGGVGAIIGAGMRDKTTRDVCENLSIRVHFNDLNAPEEIINLISSESGVGSAKKGSSAYKKAFERAQMCISILTVILKQNKDKRKNVAITPTLNPIDEIKKIKELYDQGIITEEEFTAKKKQLLGI